MSATFQINKALKGYTHLTSFFTFYSLIPTQVNVQIVSYSPTW